MVGPSVSFCFKSGVRGRLSETMVGGDWGRGRCSSSFIWIVRDDLCLWTTFSGRRGVRRGVTGVAFGNGRIGAGNSLPTIKTRTPSFGNMGDSLSRLRLGSLGKGGIIVGIFPDLSATIYTTSMEHFGGRTTSLPGAIILTMSGSLPFTRKHFYAARNVSGIVPLSTFHYSYFRGKCKVLVISNPLGNLLTHNIVIISRTNGIICRRLISRVAGRPGCRTTVTSLGGWWDELLFFVNWDWKLI